MRKAFWVDQSGSGELIFEFQLAERLHRTVGELRESMTQKEFKEWQVYTRHINRLHAEEIQRAKDAQKGRNQ